MPTEASVGLLAAGLVALMAILALTRPFPRGERGEASGGFMKGVVKVSLIVMLVAGGLVWIVDRAEENNRESDPDSQTERPDKPKRDQGNRR